MRFQQHVTQSSGSKKAVRYRARYRLGPDQPYVRAPETFPSKREAQKWLDREKSALEQGRGLNKKLSATMTLREWGEVFWPTQTKLTAKTRKDQMNWWKRHILPRFGDWRLCDIDRAAIVAWGAELNDSGYSTQTVHHWYTTLKKVIDAAVYEGPLTHNPFPPPRKAPIKPVRKVQLKRWLEDVEIHSLADAIDERYRAAIYVMGLCGVRPGEMAALRIDDIDFRDRVLTVDESMSEGDDSFELTDLKNQSSYRQLPDVPLTVLEALDLHIDKYLPDARSRDFVFTSPTGSPLNLNNWKSRYFNRAVEAAVSEGRLSDDPRVPTPKDLRHTAATLWIDEGLTVSAVAKRLGHSSTQMVDRVYGHLFEKRYAENARALDARMNAAREADGNVASLARRRRMRLA